MRRHNGRGVDFCSPCYYNGVSSINQQSDYFHLNVNKQIIRTLCDNNQDRGDLMNTEKPDRRVKYTKMVLKQSLLELIAEMSISKVTIKEICDLADVNRGTFYKHYNDQYHLLDEIQSELLSEMRATIEKRLTLSSSSVDIINETIRCMAAQSSLCKIVCSEYGDVFVK